MKIMRARQNGVTIVELLIALVLGLVVLGAVVQVFANNKNMYIAQEARARLQENGRYALHAITEKIRKSGFVGCATRSKGDALNNVVKNGATNYLYDFKNPIQGSEATAGGWSPAPHASVVDELAGTDILTIRYSDITYDILSHATHTANITISNNHDLSQGEFVIASDCAFATVFQITNDPGTTGLLQHGTAGVTPANRTNSLIREFDPGEISRVKTVSYYISDQSGLPSLYRVEFGGTPELMVAGVNDLQVEYGVDTTSSDGAVDEYVAANAVSDWEDVVAVRVNLNVRSEADDLKVDESSTNGYFESQLSRTISLRNKVP